MKLTRCLDHPDCVLRVDEEGATHTPAAPDERFPDWPPTRGEWRRGQSDSLIEARLERFLADALGVVRTQTHSLEASLSRALEGLQSLSPRIVALEKRMAAETGLREQVAASLAAVREQVQKLTSHTGEQLGRHRETISSLTDQLASLSSGAERLSGEVETLERSVAHERQAASEQVARYERTALGIEARSRQMVSLEAMAVRLAKLETLVEKERSERVAATRKLMRSVVGRD